jgi:hypothetical protein
MPVFGGPVSIDVAALASLRAASLGRRVAAQSLQDQGAIHTAGSTASPWIRISKYTPVSWLPPLAPACATTWLESTFAPAGDNSASVLP